MQTQQSIIQTCQDLLTCPSERQSITLAQTVIEGYQNLASADKNDLFHTLQKNALWGHALLCRLNAPQGQTMPLIHMRADLLDCIKQDPTLAPLDTDFKAFLEVLFNRSLITFEQISWNKTPRASLQKIMDYEAIHQMGGWDDLKNRLIHPDRLMYAFFHPLLGDEPLIFTEVALMNGNPTLAHAILDENRTILSPEGADTATFYGISKSHAGLWGIPFGNLLLKQVVRTIKAQFDHIDNFVTLSPITGLTQWANGQLDNPNSILNDAELKTVQSLQQGMQGDMNDTQATALITPHSDTLKTIITKHILQQNKERKTGGSINRVAHFHLGNGAELNDIQILADFGRMHQSYGCMVNYRYRLQTVEDNIVTYSTQQKIALSETVGKFAQPSRQKEKDAL